MADNFKHIRFTREENINPRRGRRFIPQLPVPKDIPAHGKRILTELKNTIKEAEDNSVAGFDNRFLIKVQVAKDVRPEDFENLGVEVVSEESQTVILAFADNDRLAEFEARLATIMRGEQAEKQALFYAMEAFTNWTPEDRKGGALLVEGFPEEEEFVLDIELWPIATKRDREKLIDAFDAWLGEHDIAFIDTIDRASLVMYRVKTSRVNADLILKHRDVRMVDLPPRYGFSQRIGFVDVDELPEIESPDPDAPGVVILDTGVESGHPLLGPAFGEGQCFVDGEDDTEDVQGHGTSVAGIALYGDIHRCLETRKFTPSFWIFSGRVLDENLGNETGFLENQIANAVDYFSKQYGCRVFNVSFEDWRKPYDGRHIRGLAVTLDELAREKDVLFVVSAGNFEGTKEGPKDWAEEYPTYLTSANARLFDPATAINALTVGSIARWDQPHAMQRDPNDATIRVIARRDEPSPFTRCGPSVGGAIKPELVDYGGNKYVRSSVGHDTLFDDGLGEISAVRSDFGGLVGADCGTSFAAPRVSHYATAFLTEFPEASNDLIRAALVANARHPQPCKIIYPKGPERLFVCGYGQVNEASLLHSTQNAVTLWTEDVLEDKKHHFYELPVPIEFFSGNKRERELTIALAYTPAVRSDRIGYRASRMYFQLIEADSIDEVLFNFNKATPKEDYEALPEFNSGRNISSLDRNKGTLQCATWRFIVPTEARRKRKMFIVVTRNDFPWATDLCAQRERYALVATLNDRLASEAKLYTDIQNTLAQRIRQREEARQYGRGR